MRQNIRKNNLDYELRSALYQKMVLMQRPKGGIRHGQKWGRAGDRRKAVQYARGTGEDCVWVQHNKGIQ